MVLRMLKELREKYKELSGNCKSMRNGIGTISKNQLHMKYTTSDSKNTLEGTGSRLHEAEDRVSDLEDRKKTTPNQSSRKKKN